MTHRISDAEYEWRSCTRKLRYRTWDVAHGVAVSVYASDRVVIHAYLCRFCGRYHVGHTRKRNEPALRKRMEKVRRKALWKP